MGQEASDERVCFQLGKLLLPGGLRSFVQHHPEFSWISHGQKGTGMLVTWAPPGPPKGPPPAYFDAPPAPPHDDALETSLADSDDPWAILDQEVEEDASQSKPGCASAPAGPAAGLIVLAPCSASASRSEQPAHEPSNLFDCPIDDVLDYIFDTTEQFALG